MTTDTNQEPELNDEYEALLSGEINDGEHLQQTAVSIAGNQEYEYKLLSFIPSIAWKNGDPPPKEAAHLIIPDVTKARIYRAVGVFQTSFIPKVSPAYNRLFLNVNSNNWPNPTPLQDSIWKSVISRYIDQDTKRAKPQQIYLVPCISLRNEEPEPVIVEMTVKAYNAVIEENEKADSYTKGTTNLRTSAIRVWRLPGIENQGETKAEFDGKTDIKPILKELGGQLPDVAAYVKLRSQSTEQYFKNAYAAASIGHKEFEVSPQDMETEFADLVPNLDPDQLRALFNRFQIDFPTRANKMALIDIALSHRNQLFEAVKEVVENNPPF
jgi:hypothetical protein